MCFKSAKLHLHNCNTSKLNSRPQNPPWITNFIKFYLTGKRPIYHQYIKENRHHNEDTTVYRSKTPPRKIQFGSSFSFNIVDWHNGEKLCHYQHCEKKVSHVKFNLIFFLFIIPGPTASWKLPLYKKFVLVPLLNLDFTCANSANRKCFESLRYSIFGTEDLKI